MINLNSSLFTQLTKEELYKINGGAKNKTELVGVTEGLRRIDCPKDFPDNSSCFECYTIESWREVDKHGNEVRSWTKEDICK